MLAACPSPFHQLTGPSSVIESFGDIQSVVPLVFILQYVSNNHWQRYDPLEVPSLFFLHVLA